MKDQEGGDLHSIQGRKVYNRILALMAHTTRYAFKGESRLAFDAGVSKSAVCRLVNGQSSPSFVLVVRLTQVLERQLGKALDPRDLISLDGTYPTPSVCQLAGCYGCLPAQAFDEEDNLKTEFKDIKPGQWSVMQPPASRLKTSRTSPTTSPENVAQRMRTQETQPQETR
jgi:transcriptional regulator with XRE-family HTH domain